MIWIQYLAFLWALVITQIGFARSEIRFLKQHEGESVVLPCEIEQRDPAPWGVYLKRTWLNNKDVLFKYTKEDFTVGNSADKSRISVSGDPSLHSLNITISQLKANDTDRYYCEFVVENPSSADEKIPSKTEYFLLVGAGGHWCGCSSYSSLLYVLSSAVGVLLLLLLLTGCVLCKGKARHKARRNAKSHSPAPIYEEMKSPSQKEAPLRLKEMGCSEYRDSPAKRSSSENHYETPRTALNSVRI